MELIALGTLALSIFAFGVYVTIKCTKAERAYNAEIKSIAKAKAEMSSFKREELKRLIAARAAIKA